MRSLSFGPASRPSAIKWRKFNLLLGALIISGWPGSAAWALGLIVGVNLITSGLAIIMVALAAQRLANAVENSSR